MIVSTLIVASAFAWFMNRSHYFDAIERVVLIRGWLVAVAAGGCCYTLAVLF